MPLELVPCGLDNFNYTDKEEIVFKDVDTFKCLKDKSKLRLRSTFAAKHFNMLDIRLYACVNSTDKNFTCKTPEEQQAFLDPGVTSSS